MNATTRAWRWASYYILRTFSSEEGIEEFGDDNQIDADRVEFLGQLVLWSSLRQYSQQDSDKRKKGLTLYTMKSTVILGQGKVIIVDT